MYYKNTSTSLVFGSDHPYSVLDTFSGYSGIKHITLESGSHVVYLAILDNSAVDLKIDIVGEHAHIEFFGIFVGNVSSQILTSLLRSHSFAQVNLFCIVKEDTNMHVDGNIFIDKLVEGSEGYLLEEQFLLGTPKSLLVRPILDIHSYRVKASHGAKIHTLDKDKLFYMMSKGLSLQDAQKIVVEATLRSLFDRIDDFEGKESVFLQVLATIFAV